MTIQNHYTFGDGTLASRRLALLAQAYEPPSRALLELYRPRDLGLALDLGCGPGHTTRLVHRVSGARRTLGLEASERYLSQAREGAPPGVEFVQEDVTAPSRRVPAARVVFCRFLLTHLADPEAALCGFRELVEPGGVLLLQETARLASEHPAFCRYYELVAQLQAHYGQRLYIGQELEQLAAGAPFQVLHSQVRRFEQPAATMAELHALNLATWRFDEFAQRAFDGAELEQLEQRLLDIARGAERVAPVSIGLGELALG